MANGSTGIGPTASGVARGIGAAVLLACGLALAGPARAAVIDWAGAVAGRSGFSDPAEPEAALGAPPGNGQVVFTSARSATYINFDARVAYGNAALASALGLTAAQLGDVDLLLFDFNGGPVGFEQAELVIDDGSSSLVVSHAGYSASPSGAVLANKAIAAADFDALFGTSLGTLYVGVLAIDVTGAGVDPYGSLFGVQITGGGAAGSPPDEPDLLALGVLRAALPEPATGLLLGLACAGLLAASRARRARLAPAVSAAAGRRGWCG